MILTHSCPLGSPPYEKITQSSRLHLRRSKTGQSAPSAITLQDWNTAPLLWFGLVWIFVFSRDSVNADPLRKNYALESSVLQTIQDQLFFQGIARTQSPLRKNYALESSVLQTIQDWSIKSCFPCFMFDAIFFFYFQKKNLRLSYLFFSIL